MKLVLGIAVLSPCWLWRGGGLESDTGGDDIGSDQSGGGGSTDTGGSDPGSGQTDGGSSTSNDARTLQMNAVSTVRGTKVYVTDDPDEPTKKHVDNLNVGPDDAESEMVAVATGPRQIPRYLIL